VSRQIDDILDGSGADRFTVLTGNELTGVSRYVGDFQTEEDAWDYASREIPRSRGFVTYQLWSGTPGYPRRFIRTIGRGCGDRQPDRGQG
jgi:hypothetical protein